MSAQNPAWVIGDLMDVLGLDKETVETMIVPDLINYTNEPRLRSHLQDFLGPSPQAKTFINRYVSFRFPNIASASSSSSSPALTPSHTGSQHPDKPTKGGSSSSSSDLTAKFGPGGKVHQKDVAPSGGSGSRTPVFGRPGGAVTFNMAEPKVKRLDPASAGSGSGSGSGSAGGKGKQGDKIWDAHKSREVRRLEGIIGDLKGLQNSEGKVRVDDEAKECFCQARNHSLSRYTPHCPHCGLILCQLHRPHHPCPSCKRTLQTPAQLSRLINQIQAEVEAQLAVEEAQHEAEERARLEQIRADSGGGAFPSLGPGGGPVLVPSQVPQDKSRKVLTIGGAGQKGKGKGKATLTTTTTHTRPSPAPSRPATPPPTDIVPRPRSPLLDPTRGDKELGKVLAWREAEDRPWGDMKLAKRSGGGWNYVESALVEMVEEDHVGRRKKKGKEHAAAKGLGQDGKKVVGAAA